MELTKRLDIGRADPRVILGYSELSHCFEPVFFDHTEKKGKIYISVYVSSSGREYVIPADDRELCVKEDESEN